MIAAVGRAKKGPEQTLIDTYRRRLRWPLEIREVEEKRPLAAPERKQREAARLLAAVPENAVLVALDARGETLDSGAFADRLRRWQEAGTRDLAFVIGGADGLDASVRRRANLVLALGSMTWPHLLARAMVVEQLYRAQQILAGHPYHRGHTKGP